MKAFTIDAENNITVYPSRKAARETGLGVFASPEELGELIGPDNKRLVEIWNSLSGVKPLTKFANRKAGAERIWRAIQNLGATSEGPAPESEPNDVPDFDAIPAEFAAVEPDVAAGAEAAPDKVLAGC